MSARKSHAFVLFGLLNCFATSLASFSNSAHGALIDFNTAGDLANNFFISDPAPFPYAETDGVGVGNPASRGLSVTGTTDHGATLNTSSYTFGSPGAKVSVSMFFHTAATLGTTGEDRVFELNLVSANNSDVTAAHTGIGGKIEFPPTDGVDDIRVEFRRNNSDVAGSDVNGPFDVKTNTWYKATFTATNNGTASVIPATMVLDEYNADGTSVVAANVFSHSFDIPAEATLTADTEVFGAFRVRNATRLYNALDNFEVLQLVVPEPGTISLAIAVALGLSFSSRRRRASR
ncbi:MAG TPA: PEP-CTERM sorting domain-containing protein [Lacipirellulaceae bacterium]|nr:PEP-CTERM sorting domain-containing protein [Lacipirellulaceae bacterium]